MKISVIIPSLNRKNLILNLLDDLKKQSLQPLEIIVVDQSSNPYQLKDCHYIYQDKKGPCKARNKGAEISRGDILVFLDDDERVEPDFLMQLCSLIIEGREAVVCGAICDQKGDYSFHEKCLWQRHYTIWINALTANPGYLGKGISLGLPGGCFAILKALFLSIGGFDPYFDDHGISGEDRELGVRLYKFGHSIHYNGLAKIKHHVQPFGGRREMKTNCDFNPLELNSLYTIRKHFGEKLFKSTYGMWQIQLLIKYISWNPLILLRGIKEMYLSFKAIESMTRWLPHDADHDKPMGID